MQHTHLLEIWDPIVGPDYLQAHSRVLLDSVHRFRAGQCGEDDVFVWWGHDRGDAYRPPDGQLQEILDIPVEPTRNDPAPETLLYLTDFASLYVAHLGGVTRAEPPKHGTTGVPRMYRHRRAQCDVWYRLWDIRRIVDRDTQAVARELRKLRLSGSDRPVGLRDGIPRAPFLVSSGEDDRYFEPAIRREYIADKFWVEFDSTRVNVGAVERDLRRNHFGDEVWSRFNPLTRTFIATAETLWRDHATDPLFDIGVVLIELAKAVEVHVNGIFQRVLQDAPPSVKFVNRNGQSVDLSAAPTLNLSEAARYLASDQTVFDYFRKHLKDGQWFAGELPAILNGLAEPRNRSAHPGQLTVEEVALWRNHLMGIGCHGHLMRLAMSESK